MYGRDHQGISRSAEADGDGLFEKIKSWFQGNF